MELGFVSSWSPDGRIIIAGDNNPYGFGNVNNDLHPQQARLFAIEYDVERIDNLQTIFITDVIPSTFQFMRWSSDSRYFFSGFAEFSMEEATTQIYDFETGESCELIMSSELVSGLYSLTWSPLDGDWIMVTSAGGFYHINPETCERTVPVIVPANVGGESVTWSPDYSQFIAQTLHGLILVDINGTIIRQISDDGTAQLR